PIGMGTRDVEARHTARPTEMMLGGHGAEAIRGERVRAGEQTEALARDDVMQVALAPADGAVAVDHPYQVRGDLEAHSPAMAAAGAGCRAPSSVWRASSPATRPPGPSSPPPATGSPTTT